MSQAGNVDKSAKSRGISCVTSTPIRKVTIKSLKEQLRRLHLPTTGNKTELQRRLEAYEDAREENDDDSDPENDTIIKNANPQESNDDDEDEDDQEAEDEDEQDELDEDRTEQRGRTSDRRRQRTTSANRRSRRSSQAVSLNTASMITIKDVEDSISHFSGDDQLKIEQWIDEFEDASMLLQWSDLQKVIYARKLLRVSAKQFMALQKGITTWKAMRKRLLCEFETKYNSAMVHSQLIKRKRLQNETPRQYIYAMQTIASQGIIEEEALIQYVIDGILDEECNKGILYGSDSVTQLRKNLEYYDRMKERIDKKSRKEQTKDGKKKMTEKSERKSNKKEVKETRCFSCGSADHLAKNCPHKEEGPKCFKCNQFGHIATKCSASS